MTNLSYFFRNVFAKNTSELDNKSTNSFDRVVSFRDYQGDRHKAIVTQTIRSGKTGQVKITPEGHSQAQSNLSR